MPWQKSFDRTQAIDQAMQLFWRRGYEGTSMADLVDVTGASRYGLYDEFGDKRGLFVAVLDRYLTRLVQPNYKALNHSDAGLADIRAFFEAAISYARSPAKTLGCLMCHTAGRPIGREGDVAIRVVAFLELLERSFGNALQNAHRSGELPADAKPHDLAIYFAGLVLTASLLCRSDMDADKTSIFLQTGLTVLSDIK